MGARNRVEIVVVIPAGQAPQPGGIGSLESIHGHLKSLKIRTQYSTLKTSGGRLFVMVFLALMMPSLKSSLSGARVCNCVQIILLKVYLTKSNGTTIAKALKQFPALNSC